MKKADVLLLCEGTYPYIGGGVSSWVHTLVNGLKEFTFGVIFIGAFKEMYGDMKYKIPENVLFIETHFLFEKEDLPTPRRRRMGDENIREIRELVKWFKTKDETKKYTVERIYELLKRVKLEDFLYSEESWAFITEEYFKNADNIPFVDYFWTHRNMHIPIWRVHKIAQQVEDNFTIIHSPSTGYAGLLGVFLKSKTGKPFIIHEHGIYVKERKLDISMAHWIKDYKGLNASRWEESYLKRLWSNFFFGINILVYDQADLILSLFRGAQRVQIDLGAKKEKTDILPNGVDIKAFEKCLLSRPQSIPKVVALIGRVVSIKDVRTYIMACKVFLELMPDAECWIVGEEDEDPEYTQSCKALAKSIGVWDKVKFLGFQNVKDIFPQIGVCALTSISEGLPLTILEAFASGVPVVATDVGACRELIEGGLNEEDISIGHAGIVVTPGNPYEAGMAFYKLLSDERLWKNCQEAALKRVKKFYSLEIFLDNYRKVYKRFMYGGNRV